jgi:hypothetical protein
VSAQPSKETHDPISDGRLGDSHHFHTH